MQNQRGMRVRRYFRRYRGHLAHLAIEEWGTFFTRWLPGSIGVGLRWVLHRLLWERMSGFAILYPGVTLTHTYGLRAGREISINTGAHLDARGGITIGDGVMIGPYVVIASSEHDHRQHEVPMTAVDHVMRPVSIGNDVWIGAHAVVRGGVTLGDGCVVAAGAVVTRDVAPLDVVAGVPARVVGNRQQTQSG